jgi:hypothetical protein
VERLERDIGVVTQVGATAGSVIIFAEAVTHGTMPWRAAHQIRAVIYRYSPGGISYA